MNRSELKDIASAMRIVRPTFTKAGGDGITPFWQQWRTDCESLAAVLKLDEKTRSIFLATCGMTTNDQRHGVGDPHAPHE